MPQEIPRQIYHGDAPFYQPKSGQPVIELQNENDLILQRLRILEQLVPITPMIQKSINFMVENAKDKYRKISGEPYAVHPLEVAIVLASKTQDEEEISAAILHDDVEDSKKDDLGNPLVTINLISREFTPRVAKLVDDVTADEMDRTRYKLASPGAKTRAWKIMKKKALEKALRGEQIAAEIKLADLTANLKSCMDDFTRIDRADGTRLGIKSLNGFSVPNFDFVERFVYAAVHFHNHALGEGTYPHLLKPYSTKLLEFMRLLNFGGETDEEKWDNKKMVQNWVRILVQTQTPHPANPKKRDPLEYFLEQRNIKLELDAA